MLTRHNTSRSVTGYSESSAGLPAEQLQEGVPQRLTPGSFAWSVVSVTLVLVFTTALQCHVATGQTGNPSHWIPALLYGWLLWGWWAAVWLVLWRVGHRFPALWHISWRSSGLNLIAAVIMALVHLELLSQGIHLMIRRWPYLRQIGYETLSTPGLERLSIEVSLYMVAWAVSAAINTQLAIREGMLHTALLKQQLSVAHLRALQMQMEPHFLLNTLNAITTLIEEGSRGEATETLSHLNAILKSTLVRDTPRKVSLAQELALVDHYLAIEQIRFADRLRVEMSIDPSALDCMVPCFLLQPLVENAIRHGISRLEENGVISTSIEREGDLLRLSVRDNGPGLEGHSAAGHGIGLRNTSERLSHFYASRYQFSSGRTHTGDFEVSIVIPYETCL